jgi:molybdopterin-guanine dinucleotide biosynthesis protein A
MQQTNILLEQRRIRLTEEEVTTKTTTIPITTDTTTVQQNNVAIAKNNYEKNYRATLVKYLSDSLTNGQRRPSKETINGIKTILNDENFKYISLLTAADFPNVSKDFLPFKMFKKQIGMDDVKKLLNGEEVNGIRIADSFVIR